MGQISVSKLVIGKYASVRDARVEMEQDSREEYGYDPYSGAIHNIDTYRDKTSEARRFGTKAFEAWESKMSNKLQKSEGIYVEIKGAALKRLKGTRYKGKRGIKAFYFFGEVRD